MSDLASRRTEPSTNSSPDAATRLEEVEQVYRQGQTVRLLEMTADGADWGLSPTDSARLLVLRGMAMFDVGDIVGSLAALTEATVRSSSPEQQLFQATFALLLRASDFYSPEELLPTVSRLRQLAAKIGDAESLASLHLAVARLEGIRGRCLDAHRHLEIAKHLATAQVSDVLRCFMNLVEASLEAISGNLQQVADSGRVHT